MSKPKQTPEQLIPPADLSEHPKVKAVMQRLWVARRNYADSHVEHQEAVNNARMAGDRVTNAKAELERAQTALSEVMGLVLMETKGKAPTKDAIWWKDIKTEEKGGSHGL